MTTILIATPLFPPDIGGPATYSAVLTRELPKRGFAIEIAGFSAFRWLPRGIRHVAYFFMCVWKGRGADIIYAQDPFSVGFPAMLAAKLLRKKFVLKVVGDYAWEIFQGKAGIFVSLDEFQHGRYDLFTEIRRFIEKRVARSAHAVITPSAYLKNVVTGWGVPAGNIHVIYNAFEAGAAALTREDARRTHGLSGHVILSAGRLVPWKGFAALIDIMPGIAREYPDAVLLIAGDGEERDALEFHIKALGMREHVRLLGRVGRDALLEYVRGSDCFALNTGYEGFSHQILEALAVGASVVTTRIGGNPELIRDGENGFLVNYDDRAALEAAIMRVFESDALRAQFAARGPETAHQFSKERMIGELVLLMKRL